MQTAKWAGADREGATLVERKRQLYYKKTLKWESVQRKHRCGMETGWYETKKQQREEMRNTRSKTVSEIDKLTVLYKQMLLLGNCGLLLETRKALCHRKGKGDRER